ncbi:MAG TPA: DNA methyltransferase, partial [Chitinophagales bacterium]|nr:DNA methyltransferase [Chitinophagales bacterium]
MAAKAVTGKKQLHTLLKGFRFNAKSVPTLRTTQLIAGHKVPVFVNEFWTAKKRQANAIHEISYRACFKPELPRFFIERFTQPGDVVYDPFNGRGTTTVEAALLGRHMVANDVNPLSLIFTRPRIAPPTLQQVKERLQDIPYIPKQNAEIDLSMFFEKNTLSEIVSLRNYLMERLHTGKEDNTDRWIRMVATNRLTGHSKGFFSVYSLPPNQAMSQERQIKVNKARGQKPDYRDTKKLMFTKSRILLRDTLPDTGAGIKAKYLNCDAGATRAIKSGSVSLTVTSPPFLDIVQYAIDNWMRCWFNNIDMAPIERNITMSRTVDDWAEKMRGVFRQLYRVTKPGGVVA